MGLPQHTTTEKPSVSETGIDTNQSESIGAPAAEVSTQNSSLGATDSSQIAGGAIGGAGSTHGSAEEAADKLYEERMEDEYAKREGGA